MASRLMQKKARLVAYMPSLRAAVRHFRAFSSYDEQQPDQALHVARPNINDPSTEWPDTRLGPFSPDHHRFPLPGLTGPSAKVKAAAATADVEMPDVLSQPSLEEQRINVLQQYIQTSNELAEEAEQAGYMPDEPSVHDLLECVAQDCPQLLKKDFQELFPDHNLSSWPLTVLTLSQRTQNDMSGWTPQVEAEREELLEHFITGASEICDALREAGYWADFIDPSSGRPYLGEYTNATLFETDERYRHFGFEIDDLGCCKVISHHLWGTQAYVGCLCTNAPLDHPIIRMMSQVKASGEC